MSFFTRVIVKPLLVPGVIPRPAVSSLYSAIHGNATFSTKGPKATLEKHSTDPKKSKISPKITLISADESISIVNLDEAIKISTRRNLKLIKINALDNKTQRPVYRLMTGAEYLNEDIKQREEKKKSKQEATIKGDKLLTITSKIAEHDLNSKIQNVLRWLNKSYEVRIVISGDGTSNRSKQEGIAQKFELSMKDAGRIVQKRFRENDLRFQVLPTTGAVAKKKELLEKNETTEAAITADAQSARALHQGRALGS